MTLEIQDLLSRYLHILTLWVTQTQNAIILLVRDLNEMSEEINSEKKENRQFLADPKLSTKRKKGEKERAILQSFTSQIHKRHPVICSLHIFRF